MRVYHIVSSKWGLENIREKRLKISRISDLNDPFELLGANLREKSSRLAFQRWKNQLNDIFGILCFSKTWKNPLLWSHYGEKHAGLCLGFDIPDEMIVEVAYQRNRIDITDTDLDEQTIMKFISCKFLDWSYENEVRVITGLTDQKSPEGHYYANFDRNLILKEVVVGALCNISRHDLVDHLLHAGLHLPEIKMTKARSAFKSFQIVEDKRGFR